MDVQEFKRNRDATTIERKYGSLNCENCSKGKRENREKHV